MMTKQESKKEQYEFVIANWYNALKQIKDRNGRVGRMSEFIKARNLAPFEDNIWKYGAYSTAGLDYAQENPILLTRENSELLELENAKKAVQLHKNNKEYPITQEAYNSHLKQAEKESKKAPEKRSILILPERANFDINSQNHFDVLRFSAEDPKEAEKYLGRLSEKDIEEISFNLRDKEYVDEQESPFQDQLWLRRLGFRSYLGGVDRSLDYGRSRVFRVFGKTGEASSKKISPCSAKEALKMYKIVEEIRKGNIKLSDLELKLSEVSSFLENLSDK